MLGVTPAKIFPVEADGNANFQNAVVDPALIQTGSLLHHADWNIGGDDHNVDQYVMKDKALLYDTPEEFKRLRGEKGVRGTVTWGTAEKGKKYHEAVVEGMAAFIQKHKNRIVEIGPNIGIV